MSAIFGGFGDKTKYTKRIRKKTLKTANFKMLLALFD
jgi:hypothetical protein